MKLCLFILCAAELLLTTYWQNIAGPFISPVLLLASSIGIGICFLKISIAPPTTSPAPANRSRLTLALQALLFCALSYFIIKTLKTIWWWDITQHNAVNKSDIIQMITILVQRFLAHQPPYTVIHFKNYDIPPTYLPFQWFPYILTELAHKDYRWVPAISLWLASLYFFIKNCSLRYTKTPVLFMILVPVWPLIVWFTTIMHYNPMFQITVEGLIAAYYLFVATAIGGRHVATLIAGIALCLLSRYSIILWVPLCVAAFFIAGQRKKAFIITGILLLCFIVFYWLPFFSKDPTIFIKGYNYYSSAVLQEWQRDLLLGNNKFYLDNGLGFTAWALKFVPGNVQQVFGFYKLLHLSLCMLVIVTMLVFYWFRKHKVPLNIFLLFSFKIYLAIFYSFIIIPYNYLYLVPVIISSALLANGFKQSAITGNSTPASLLPAHSDR